MTTVDMAFVPIALISAALILQSWLWVRLDRKVGIIVADFQEALQAWVDYAEKLKAERDEHAEALKQALATNAELIATDAATDAEQAEALQAQLTKNLEDTLAALQDTPDKPKLEGVDQATDVVKGGKPDAPDLKNVKG